MKYYIEMNKQMLRSFFISEVLPKNTVINKDGNKIEGYLLYNDMNFLNKSHEFILEIGIDLNRYRKIKLTNSIFVLETLYEELFSIKNIYYTSENLYQDFLIEKKTLGDIKLIKRITFVKVDSKNHGFTNNEIKINVKNLMYYKKINEMNTKNNIIYDTLKGSIYMSGALNIENIFTCRQRKIVGQVNELKNEICNINATHLSIKDKNRVKRTLALYINNRNKKIINDKNKFYYISANEVRINKKIINNDLLNKIINIIIYEKAKIFDLEDNLIENIIIDLGNLSKKENNVQLYNDCKKIYSLVIKDNINYSYDDISNQVAKYLYLALEYFNKLDVLNEIIIDEEFDDYYLIYLFVGAILGYRRLSKIYTTPIKKNEYSVIINYMCKGVLNDLLITNNLNKKYVIENYNIIKKLTNSYNYPKLINKYCLHKDKNSNFEMKVYRTQKCISINKMYFIYLNTNETKYFNKEKNNYKININNKSRFKSFKITNAEGRKLNEIEVIELNSILEEVLISI